MKYVIFFFTLMITQAALAADPILPDPKLTPGAVLTIDANRICEPGYSRGVRHTSIDLKKDIYREYGIRYVRGAYEVDHLIPLGLGGADVRENLWPQSHMTTTWNADVKDRLEWKLHQALCAGDISAHSAQQAFAKNWITAYKHFCPTDDACPSYDADRGHRVVRVSARD